MLWQNARNLLTKSNHEETLCPARLTRGAASKRHSASQTQAREPPLRGEQAINNINQRARKEATNEGCAVPECREEQN